MAEPDHIIVKPIPNLSQDGLGAAFPFFYIEPQKYESTLRKFFPEEKGPITSIDPIGNSPVIVGKVYIERTQSFMSISALSAHVKDSINRKNTVLLEYQCLV